ncbi:MAG TPA: alpha-ketoglutarate-dependent dioxygenase AlkB [Pyrinomonadaceae bacterium]|nr:alpha-ketoglutarate-dependent dioxygenase AlkB [Pyrinomonadaceae bacterium]
MPRQTPLFDTESTLIEGLRYEEDLITPADEVTLINRLRDLPFKEFEFHGYTGKRRVVSFGWRYEYSGERLQKADDIPEFLMPLRMRAASFARLEQTALQHVLVTEYKRDTGIGWHRDKPVFGQVIGVSLLAPCLIRFRRKISEPFKKKSNWDRVHLLARPRSVYHLSGAARSEWQHSILRVDSLRYSITFRTLRDESFSRVP